MRTSLHRCRATLAALAAAAVLAPAFAAVTPAVADDAAGSTEKAWSVAPMPPKGKAAAPRNYFILEGEPGDVIKDKVLIQNFTPHPITFELFAADGYNTDGVGAFALKSRDADQVGLGKWIEPGTDSVTIYGETAAAVDIKFRIPKNATPGDHAGGVVALNTAIESRNKGAMSFGIQRAIAARAFVRVSGNTSPGLTVSDVEVEHDRGLWPWSGEGSAQVSYTVTNTGNLRLSPKGTATVSGLFTGDPQDIGTISDLLPGAQVRLTQEISGIPNIGPVDVEVEYVAGEDLGDSASGSFTLVPWPLAVLVVILAGGLLAAWLRRRDTIRRRLREAAATPKIIVEEEEPIAS